ncbi:MAG: hypothetical protein A2133_09020 [Actinobacteria bacterium RBG_16_64_13]|nr:MAG: hypothetical protein A2133_09020 [Actinobacteria bacterium RBG_16_64_13]
MRYLGIDLGSSRTGLALSDALGVICTPLTTLAEKDEQRLMSRIVAVVQEQNVETIVVGIPRPLSGGSNRQLESVLSFMGRLENEVDVPVHGWDERFTSKLAERGRSRKVAQDAVAACYMLQSFLDSGADFTGDGQADDR